MSVEWAESDAFVDLLPLLEKALPARIVHLKGDGNREASAALHRARRRMIRFLHAHAGYNVVVLPVGIFEGAWVNTQLRADSSVSVAAKPLYRVWRESEDFLDVLRYIQQTNEEEVGVEVIGGLSRYHATGKELYAPHLIQFFDSVQTDLLDLSHKEEIQGYLAGRDRLSKASAEERLQALKLTQALLQHLADVRTELETFHGAQKTLLEEQFLKNMLTFIELEQIRAEDIPEDPNFLQREKQQNLNWFLNEYFPRRKLIYWEGRGAGGDALPVANSQVFKIELTYKER